MNLFELSNGEIGVELYRIRRKVILIYLSQLAGMINKLLMKVEFLPKHTMVAQSDHLVCWASS